MAITKEDRLAAYKNANEAVAEMYGSLETARVIGSYRERYPTLGSNFVDLVGDTILGLRPRNTFEQALVSEMGISAENARSINQEFKAIFDKAEGSARPEANLETKERLDLRPRIDPGAQNNETPTVQATPKPLTREELMSALGGRRTMAQDIEALRMKRDGGGQ